MGTAVSAVSYRQARSPLSTVSIVLGLTHADFAVLVSALEESPELRDRIVRSVARHLARNSRTVADWERGDQEPSWEIVRADDGGREQVTGIAPTEEWARRLVARAKEQGL